MTATTAEQPTQIAINDIGTEEELLAAIDAGVDAVDAACSRRGGFLSRRAAGSVRTGICPRWARDRLGPSHRHRRPRVHRDDGGALPPALARRQAARVAAGGGLLRLTPAAA